MGVAFITVSTIIAYLVGSIPTGYLIARWKGVPDIRSVGSGNIGATNVGRHIGLPYFFVILLLDSAKAYFCLYLVTSLGIPLSGIYLCALALLLGNSHSLFLNFTGGKGVATGIGIIGYIFPQAILFMAAVWLAALWTLSDVGIASILSYWVLFVYTAVSFYLDPSLFSYELLVVFLVMASWITWRHQENLSWYFNTQ